MSALERVSAIKQEAESLLAEIKAGLDTITLNDAKQLHSSIREIEGWLLSARQLLEPTTNWSAGPVP